MSWQEEMPARFVSAPNTKTTPLKKGKCFSCGKTGHWASECPTKKSTSSFSQPNLNTGVAASLGYPEVICRCGAGVCEPRVAKSGNVYYKCPAESWMRCDFFMLRHKLDSRGVRPLEYPICECGAGVCLLGREAATGREYFKCRVPKGQGACSFRQWADEPVSYTKSVTVEETDYLSHPQSLGKQANHPLFEEDDSRRKFLRITELDGSPSTNSRQFSSNSATSFVSSGTKEGSSVMSIMELDDISPELLKEIMEYDYPLTEDDESSCKLRKTPESEEHTVSLSPSPQLSPNSAVLLGSSDGKEIPTQNETDLQEFETDEDFLNEVTAFESILTNVDERRELSYDYQMEEVVDTAAKLPDHKTVQQLQANFEKLIVAAASDHPQEKCVSAMLGTQYLSWLTRLTVSSPPYLILTLDKCWFRCKFPNFDPIYVPQGIGHIDERAQTGSNSVANKSLSVPEKSFAEDVPPAIILKEPSAAGSSPYIAEPDNIIAAAIFEAFGKAGMLIKTNFITQLQSMNPSSHESMIKEANTVFSSLDHLKVDYRLFRQRVKEFIDAAASLNQIELSTSNDSLFQDTLYRCKKEKLRLKQLSSEHTSAMKSFICSQDRLQSLKNEAEKVRNRLFEIEQQVCACQMETNEFDIQLAELSDQITKCQNDLQSASLEAEAGQTLSLRKEAALSVAWDVFEKAKLQLRDRDNAN